MKEFEFMTKEKAKEILEIALSTGGDFAEVFMENGTSEAFEMTLGKVSQISYKNVSGAAIRIIKGATEVNTSVTDFSYENLKKQAKALASSFDGVKSTEVAVFNEKDVEIICNPTRVSSENALEEINLLTKASNAAMSAHEEIKQVICGLTRKLQNIFVFASDGTYQKDYRCNMRLSVNCIASDGVTMHSIGKTSGKAIGLEQYDKFDVEEFARSVALDAVEMLHADPMVGGEMPVVINNGFGGVILHEACVHGLEATSVAKGMSVFCGKLGEKIASDIVNAVDDGTNLNAWGSINVDDEGTPSNCNVLIENGILKSYLVDKRNAKIMNHPITGNSRRESYKYQTTSRMTNTYFLNGKSTFDEIIANTKYGLFAKEMGGGSVNPATGEFNFAVNVGYLIEDGKITKPVKGATLVGSGRDVLLRIDMIGDNLSCGHGMCGSMSGSIPTNVGQPTIRVSSMTVGGSGKGGNK